MRVMDSIIKDIKMCIDFYLTRCNGEHPSKIFLIGGGSQMKGIEEYFEENPRVACIQNKRSKNWRA